jgi:alpha-tubulin suppressor-like RCC1 family protein
VPVGRRALVLAALVAIAACGAPDPATSRVEAQLTSGAVPVPRTAGKPLPPASSAPVIQLAAGNGHACALHADRTVSCWGSNERGQIADHETARGGLRGENPIATTAIRLPAGGPLGDVLEVAAGLWRTCVRRAEGVWCWGDPVGPPERVATLTDAVEITAQCARTADGQVWCWGDALAAGREPSLEPAIDLASNDHATCALRADGEIKCTPEAVAGRWTLNTPEQSVQGAVEIALGARELCARMHDGTVRCWRLEYLYDGFDERGSRTVPGIARAEQIVLGDAWGCARSGDRGVRCWGVIPGRRETALSAVRVNGVVADELVGGPSYACARDGGAAWCWGSDAWSVLGNGWARLRGDPTIVPGIDDAIDVEVGPAASCARRRNGQVWCWGRAPVDGRADAAPRELVAARGATAIAVPFDTVCARFADGDLRCGAGDVLASIGIRGASRISASATHLVATMPGGTIMSSGMDSFGQFGTGMALGLTTAPRRGKDITGVLAAAAGENVTCLIQAAGTVACLGRRFGVDSFRDNAMALTPLPVPGLDAAVEVDIAEGFACARIAGGTVSCWGTGRTGQLGRPTSAVALVPLPVPGLTDVVQLAGARWAMCARRADRTIACWGNNNDAILGEPWAIDWADHPVVHPQTDVVDLSIFDHACAVLGSGQVACWGAATTGQLGIPGAPDPTTPVRVAFPTERR